ncbi:MAG: biotin/lipoyl-binding protein, partial [Lentisphaerae bacterium]|nr:biotin/lipoyl-binding protein [Lentisphaerota bacterium]
MSDFRATTGESVPLSSLQSRRRAWKISFYICLVTAVLVSFLVLVRIEQKIPAVGYVTTEEYAEIRSPRMGKIKEILIKSGNTVQPGDILVQLDSSEAEALLEQSEYQVGKVKTEIEKLSTVHKEQRMKHEKLLTLAELHFKDAKSKLTLTERLSEKGLASEIAVEDRRLALELAEVELNALKSEDETLEEKEMAVLLEELKAAEQAVKLHKVRLEEFVVRAPFAGSVIRHDFIIGEIVGPDTVLYELFGGDQLVLKVMVDERHAALVRTGMRYRA